MGVGKSMIGPLFVGPGFPTVLGDGKKLEDNGLK